jgi:TetR/AcrR family transcriptional regulator, fatty acid metabolism regulator protein
MIKEGLSKRDIILNSAIKVIAEKGYYSCRTLDISGDAGVAYGSLYQYFKSKEDILLSIFRERWGFLIKQVQKVNKTIPDPVDKLKAIFDYIFVSYEHNPELMKVMIIDIPRVRQFYTKEDRQLYKSFFMGVEGIFKEGQDEGIFCSDVSPTIATFVIYGAVDATIRQYVYNPDFNQKKFPLAEANRQIMIYLNNGILTKKGISQQEKKSKKAGG